MKKLLNIFLAIGFLTSSLLAQVNVGEEAPNFTLTSLENQQIELSALEGKVVYIFFFGSNCPHCRSNGPITEDEIYQMFKDEENFVAIGIDTWNTSAAEVTNFKNVTGITYTLLLNGQNVLIDYYGNASAYDRSLVIASDGTIAYKGNDQVYTDYEIVNESIQEELSIVTTNEGDNLEVPSSIRLDQNYPNPFNPATTISYSLSQASEVSVTVYNMLGVKVETLFNGFRSAGKYTVSFDATSLSSGIYIYQLKTGSKTITKRMTLLK